MKILLLSLFFASAFAVITCPTGQDYVQIMKQSKSYADEESVKIMLGATTLYTSPAFVANQQQTFETCVQGGTNSQYTLNLEDNYGDSWTSGSWVAIKGKYGNYFFRGYMTESYTETYSLSLYYPVTDDCAWKLFSGSEQAGWNTLSFNDIAWTEVFLDSVTTPVQGTQYFRKTYTGVTGMAAYELAMKYTTGIVAYINGVVIYRDNMPDGPVTTQTQATGVYPINLYHNILRPGSEASAASSVLAIEIHSYTTPLTAVNFNAWMALIAPSTRDEKPCFVYPGDATTGSATGSNPSYAFNWGKGDYFYISSATAPITLSYTLSGPKAFINGIRVWPGGLASSTPRTIELQGSHSLMSGTWTSVLSMNNAVHNNNQYTYQFGVFNAALYSLYQVVIQPTNSYMYVYEMQPMVCDVTLPTSIEFEQVAYTGYAGYSTLTARPLLNDWTGCQVNPALPAGLVLSTNCMISGTVATSLPATTYTVSAIVQGQTYTGTVSIEFTGCAGTLVQLTRSYKTNAGAEFFTITDTTTQQIVYQVAANSGQIDNDSWADLVCLTGNRYKVTIGATTSFWQRQSFMYVRASLSNGQTEIISRIKYNQYLNMPEETYFYPLYATAPLHNWHYKNAEIPDNWHNSDMTGFTQGTANQYPVSTNTIQLYKTTFNLNSITGLGPMSIHVRYRYGVVIYLNGREIFRNHLAEGAISTSSIATGSYTGDLIYRQITLPIHVPASGSEPAIDYVQQGTNTLAIALVSITAAQTTSDFDASLRFVGTEASSRLLSASLTWSNISGNPSYVLWWDHLSPIYYDNCPTSTPKNYYQITFANDRRDWVSAVELQLEYQQFDKFVRNFKLLARNSASEPWTTLLDAHGLTWSIVGQNRRIWVPNYKAYNMYRFEDFTTNSATDCAWKLGRFDILSQDTSTQPPALTYPSSISIFKNIEMAEVYPSSDLYTEFTVTPALPTGVTLDPYNGMISGTASAEVATATYTVTAQKYNGEGSVTATFSLDVGICHGGKSLITLVTMTDAQYDTSSYKLYQGKQVTGTPIQQIDHFKAGNILNYADFCLPHDLYTVQLVAPTANGWQNPAGYYLSVDIGSLRFDIGQVKTQTKEILFSSFLPFQQEFDNWRVYSETNPVPANWNAIAFDDSTWRDIKAADIGTTEAVTVYIRRSFTIPDINDYQVLNAHVKYAGGVAAYFNGNLVARFNLEEYFTPESTSISTHNINNLSKFHVILPLAGGVTGANVMAFEIHRPNGAASTMPVVFDATGVFGVNECSVLVDTYLNIGSSDTNNVEDASAFFDMTTASFGSIPNAVGSYIYWTVENLAGSKFNSFALQTTQSVNNFGFSLYGRSEADAELLSMFAEPGLTVVERERSAFEVPVGIASFRMFRYEVDQPASSTVIFSTILTQYCKATGEVCQALEEYPPVASGQISPAPCPEGYRGYAYRLCTGTTFGEVMLDKCSHKLPDKLVYTTSRLTFVMGTTISTPPPTYVNIIEEFYLAENTQLPAGLTLNTKTGQIEGQPTEITGVKLYTIYGKNPSGATMATVPIEVRIGECAADGDFPLTEVGKTYVFDCTLKGSYMGSVTRQCVLGAVDGEWSKNSGMCISTTLVWVLVLVVVVAIIVVIVIINNKKSAAAAAAAKKKKASSKKIEKKPSATKKDSTKTVKI